MKNLLTQSVLFIIYAACLHQIYLAYIRDLPEVWSAIILYTIPSLIALILILGVFYFFSTVAYVLLKE